MMVLQIFQMHAAGCLPIVRDVLLRPMQGVEEAGAEGPRLHGQNPYADGSALLIDQRSGAEEVDGKETGNLLSLGK